MSANCDIAEEHILSDKIQTTKEIYDSSQRPHPLLEEFLTLIKYRDLLYQFVSSSIKTRYKRSFLGVIWTLLNPLLMMVVLTLVFTNLFRFAIEYYPVYLLSGLLLWNFFSNTTIQALQGMVLSGGLLNRIYVPKSVFTFSALGTGLVNLSISLIPLLAITLILGMKIHISVLVMPLAIVLLAIFALGVGLILAAAAVYFADMLPVYEVILTLWMYATPIIYPPEILPPDRIWLLKLNPMYYLLQVFRRPLYEGVIPEWSEWAIATTVALAAFIAGSVIFTSRINEYAYRT